MTHPDAPLTPHEIAILEAWIRRNANRPPWQPHTPHNTAYEDHMWDLHRRALHHHQPLNPFTHTTNPFTPDTAHRPHTIPTNHPLWTPALTLATTLTIIALLALTLFCLGAPL